MSIKQNQLDPSISLGGGGGGDSTNDVLDSLARDEADTLFTENANELRDDFGDEDKGTKSNAAQSASALRITSGNTGYAQRVQEVTPVISSASGVAVMSLQAVAFKSTAIVSNVVKVDNDVTNVIGAGRVSSRDQSSVQGVNFRFSK